METTGGDDDDGLDARGNATVIPPTTRQSRHRRHESLSAPPPPPGFNPTPSFSDSPLARVTPPHSATPSVSTGSISSISLVSSDGTIQPSSMTSEGEGHPHRPELRAIQRLSNESLKTPTSGNSSSSFVSSASVDSAGQEHLDEMRGKLLHEELDVPAPQQTPLRPSILTEAALSEHDSPLTGEHAWDSVWPAHIQRPQPEAGPSRLPIAPLSPSVTPSFTPPLNSPVNRQTVGTIRTPSPVAGPSRRASIHTDSPLLIHPSQGSSPLTISRHNRTKSNVAAGPNPLRLKDNSPPESPPRSPRIGSLSKSDPASPPRRGRPSTAPGPSTTLSSPLVSGFRRPRGLSDSGSQPDVQVEPGPARSGSPRLPDLALEPISGLPPMNLPPPVTSPSLPVSDPPDRPHLEEAVVLEDSPPAGPPSTTSKPTSPIRSDFDIPRPSIRRSFSDYDARSRSPVLHRTSSLTTDLDKSPKRTTGNAALSSPISPGDGRDADTSRNRKSPRLSPNVLPNLSPIVAAKEEVPTPRPRETEVMDSVVVDEGDLLPTGEVPQMDVTFDDEGLNTLERIFLLSKSEYAFHRAYVARVLGDLLVEVDPCESVEYVLPLLSGFSVDEDDSVKEAFASELHRILWYFFSTCKLMTEEGPIEYIPPPKETLTVTSEGLDIVQRPTPAEVADIPTFNMGRRTSIVSLGQSSTTPSTASTASDLTQVSSMFSHTPDGIDTPGSMSSQETAYSPAPYVNAYADDQDPEKGWTKEPAQLVDRPGLAVNFFTPLLGSLLLSQNVAIADPVRAGVIHLIGRLRSPGPHSTEVWGANVNQPEPDERRVFASQTGPHAHDLRPFAKAERLAVEYELLQGIIIGMGGLSTEMPDMLFEDQSEETAAESEAFHAQLVLEATIGRATSMNLIGSVSEFYSAEEVVENGFVDEVLKALDGDVPVRAEAAIAMSFLAKVAPVEHVYRMLPVYEQFSADQVDHVRQSACLSLPALCRRIEDPSYKREFAVRSMESLTTCGEDVRCAALEMLGEIIHIFHEDVGGPPDELLELYVDDSEADVQQPDSDWDIIASFNFPGVCLTLGAERWHQIQPLFNRLQSRAGEKVTRTTALSLHELAKILRPDQVEADLVPVYRKLLKLNDDIREKVFEHIDDFFSSLEPKSAWGLFTSLAAAWKDNTLGGWRARERLALHVPAFLKIFRDEPDLDLVIDLFGTALVDPFAAVRNAVTEGVPACYMILGHGTAHAARFRTILVDLGTSSSYRQRMTFVRCLREFVRPPPNRQAFEEFLLPELPRLSNDVVDVRLALAQLVADLFVIDAIYHPVHATIPRAITQLIDTLSQDDAVDVRDTIKHINLATIGKGKRVPYTADAMHPSNHAGKPVSDPDLSRLSQPISGDVSSRLGSMFLSADDMEDRNSTPVAKVLAPLTTDPFAESFADAIDD